MIHSIWILSVLYRIPTDLLFFENYYHCNIYAIILISLHHTTRPSHFLFFVIRNTFVVFKTGIITTIHGCCFIISHTPPTIRTNFLSSCSTYTQVSALHWYAYDCGLVCRIDIILKTIRGEFFLYSNTLLKSLCEIQFLIKTVITVISIVHG